MPEKCAAISAAPMFIRRREMRADITKCQCAKDCIAQGMNDNVAVRMRDNALYVRDAHPAEHNVIARAKGVNVEALTDTHQFALVSRNSASAKSGGVVTL